VGRSRRGPIVVGLPTDAAIADGLPDASGRETYFGPRTLGKDGTLEEPVGVIITGVPRAGRDSDEAVARLLRERPTNPLPPAADLSDGLPARAPAPIPPLAASQQSSSEPVQPHRVRTQLERPSERNPVGTIAEGWYRCRAAWSMWKTYRVGRLAAIRCGRARMLRRLREESDRKSVV